MHTNVNHIGIVGAGLVGSLLSIYLAKRGYKVSVFERRADIRTGSADSGRSINLALSNRGIHALDEVSLSSTLKDIAIPMHGRVMHGLTGGLSFLPYGKEGQFINSIARADLNIVLLDAAEKLGVEFHFTQKCMGVDAHTNELLFGVAGQETVRHRADLMIGADGAYSSVRSSLQIMDRFSFSQEYIDHGYKELNIPANSLLEKNALHIWPRESFMMIALPNPDGSFTATLFFPFDGEMSFQALSTDAAVSAFFQMQFPDIIGLMPEYLNDFRTNPVGSLVTTKCWPWVKNRVLLLGDAAHAIVPFYGQGMNAGFEDCSVLNRLLDDHADNWDLVLPAFENSRKPDTDSIASLALDNFIEMRDLVADEKFLLRKKIEARLHQLYPEKWIPLYSMVTFHEEIPYSAALSAGSKQKAIMDKVMAAPGIESSWERLDFKAIADSL